jgi:hypothetical protein
MTYIEDWDRRQKSLYLKTIRNSSPIEGRGRPGCGQSTSRDQQWFGPLVAAAVIKAVAEEVE